MQHLYGMYKELSKMYKDFIKTVPICYFWCKGVNV